MNEEAAWADVLNGARVGDEAALTLLYRRYQPGLLRYLRAKARGQEEDLAQTTWMQVARALSGFEGEEDDFRRLLFTVAHARATDFVRQAGRRPTGPLGDPEKEQPADGRTDPEALLASDDAVRRLLALLPPAQAEVLLLRVIAGLSTEEVATILGRRPGAISVLQHRALHRLARQLEKNPEP